MERKEGQRGQNRHNQSKPYQPEQLPATQDGESPKRNARPIAWDLLERKARASDEFYSGRVTREDWVRERNEVDRLKEEIDEKGSARDRHILALLDTPRPSLNAIRSEQEQIQKWRSLTENLSDEEIADCARKQEEEIETFRRGEIPILSFHPSVGDGELILAEHIAKKGKRV